MCIQKKLGFALQNLNPDEDWRLFESFASCFIVINFPNLRTMASPSGDGGRDSELFSSPDSPKTFFQYSVSKDWQRKIRYTIDRIRENSSWNVKKIIYVTSQRIGADADRLRNDVFDKYEISLDIWDRSYFIERVGQKKEWQEAADVLVKKIVNPLVDELSKSQKSRSIFGQEEMQIAHWFLSLHLKDVQVNRNLTKLSFETLVLSSLLDLARDKQLSRKEIYTRIIPLLDNSDSRLVSQYVDKALIRLTRNKKIKHWRKDDSFCLSHEMQEQVINDIISHENMIKTIRNSIGEYFLLLIDGITIQDIWIETYIDLTLKILDAYLNQRCEVFTLAVFGKEKIDLGTTHLDDIIYYHVTHQNANGLQKSVSQKSLFDLVKKSVHDILGNPSLDISQYFRERANGYTIMAFLKQTPNVQSICKKIVSGNIWIDTCFLLPLFSETLQPEEYKRYFTRLFGKALDCGMTLYVTNGVLEEVLGHMNRSVFCANNYPDLRGWVGDPPRLYSDFMSSGETSFTFLGWLEWFRGSNTPRIDLGQYLFENHGIEVKDHQLDTNSLNWYNYVLHYWLGIHQERRERKNRDCNQDIIYELSKHDTENFVGILVKREDERTEDREIGYKNWWLTGDSAAFRAINTLKSILPEQYSYSPAMGLEFLSNYIAFCPNNQGSLSVPFLPDFIHPSFLSPELLDEAERIREEYAGYPKSTIKRMMRDRINHLKQVYNSRISENDDEVLIEDLY